MVRDVEIGTFTTRFAPDRLVALQAQRAATWAISPPPTTLVRLSREDQYLTEGMEHVRERNERWEAGMIRAAWLENRILEKYYAPVLTTASHEGGGYRWPDAQRADAQARAVATDVRGEFVSAAYPYRIYPWSKAAYWTIVSMLAAIVWLAGMKRSPLR